MSVYGTIANTSLVTGVLVFNSLDNQGQINFSESFTYDLTPFNLVDDFNVTLAWAVWWNMTVRMSITDYQQIAKLEGYPDRYRLGQVRLMYGEACLPVHYIDTGLYQIPGRYYAWVVPDSPPAITFFDVEPTELDTYDNIISTTNTSYGNPLGDATSDGATQFSWSFPNGAEADVNINYYARRLDFATDPDPAPSILWRWV